MGISEEALKRLFNPYQKAQGKKTGGEKSTGLGLVIARKITEAHGGTVTVESTAGKGGRIPDSSAGGEILEGAALDIQFNA